MAEIWKDIPNYEGLYEASSLGRIRTKEGKETYRILNGEIQKRIWKSRILKEKNPNNKSRRRDKRVDLWKEGVSKTFLVARLTAISFIENPDNLPCINHIDGNHRNNEVSNLEWCDYTYNNNHALDNGLIKTRILVSLENVETKEKHIIKGMRMASDFLERNNGYISGQIRRGKDTVSSKSGEVFYVSIIEEDEIINEKKENVLNGNSRKNQTTRGNS